MPAVESHQIVDPAIVPSLRPALPTLGAGIFTAAASGIALLGGTWCVVRVIGEPTLSVAAAACALWVLGAALSAASSWLSHHAEARFEARLRREVAAHLVRMPARTLTRFRGDELRRLVSDDISALHHLVAHLPAEIATMVVLPIVTLTLLVGAAGPVALLALIPGTLAAVFSLVVIPRMAARHVAGQVDAMGGHRRSGRRLYPRYPREPDLWR